MVDLGSEQTTQPFTHVNMSTKRKELLSNVMERTSQWILSQDIPSDMTVHVGRTSFALHKFPLVSKCGCIRKLVSKSSDVKLSAIEIPDIPGGAEAFELAAKFCYEINFEISSGNIALLRCVAEYLEMTDEYAVGNLVGLTEAYLNKVALKSIASSVSILHSSEKLLPIAEDIKLVNRSIDTISYIVCKDSQYGLNSSTFDWWAEDLTVLRIDFFQRVLIAMLSRGFKQHELGPILMLYAQKSLGDLDISGKGRKSIEARKEHEKRVVLETIVSLLPKEKSALSVSFLSLLLRAAIYLETTVSCRVDLEKRMSLQLGQAVLDDLLIPSYSLTGDTLFDVETVKRIMMNFLEYEMVGNRLGFNDEENVSPSASDMGKVGKLMQDYLAEIASDSNLSVSEFISVAKVIPEQSRITEDMMYKAIDMYLKAHRALSDVERKNVCSVMNCQKLTREARAHAAQNERLPVQIVVQVIYYEQQRLREVMDVCLVEPDPPSLPSKVNWFSTDILPVTDEVSSLKRENQDLKFELMKLKMKLKEIQKCDDKSAASTPFGTTTPPLDKPRFPGKSFISAVSRKLGKLYPSFGADEVTMPTQSKEENKPSRNRRNSIS
ncbi:BTB/POZ domain-containing protein [Capsicum annuum]|uniref:BTB/POZ domain-containing protein n=1 Tax=Capsicum annuum TaxID=4072 RepID=A0A1U8FR39_CAPAN|nr:BTB/POZ domain-containing protein SR1IP1 [Capsicum annuum]KAF3655331.1 BTB/POZ domain-containing protein [Capsicum annuum]KAF3658625.1 BTB/POZ domain-containing protein [Capsicum annuum]PHT89450.1 BTB/POZ domain-containing protein [Capsicum annuum]